MSKPALPGFALSAGMLWLLAGALYKLFDGSPNDLPQSVKDLSPLDMWGTFRLAIMVELAVVGLVIALPRIGWLFLAGAFATFIAILAPLVASGATSCGCFGSNVTIPPATMIGIDGGLLLLLLFSRPWRMPKESGLGAAAYVPLLAVAIAAPTMKLKTPELPRIARPVTGNPTEPAPGADKRAETDADLGTEDANPAPIDPRGKPENLTNGDEVEVQRPEAPVTPVEPEVSYDPNLPEFHELRWQEWTGKDFYDTDMAIFADQSMGAILPNSHVVVYRQTCEVCKEHLEQLWNEAQLDPMKWGGEKSLVLIRIIEGKDTDENNLCTLLPEPSQKVSLPALKRGYGLTTPMAFDVDENNQVQNIIDVRESLGH